MFKKDSEQKKRAFEIKKLKIEKNYKSLNWTQIIIVVLISFVVTIGTFAILSTWFINTFMVALSSGATGIGESVASAFEVNPELMFALNDNLPEEALYLTLAKQMSAEANVDFYGYFTTKTERSLEKVNLSCIDEYNYRYSLNPNVYEINTKDYINHIKWFEQLKDMGCTEYHKAENVTYFKCPLRNCEMRELDLEVSDEFIPKRIGVNKVSISGD